jgi:hypothetical protein
MLKAWWVPEPSAVQPSPRQPVGCSWWVHATNPALAHLAECLAAPTTAGATCPCLCPHQMRGACMPAWLPTGKLPACHEGKPLPNLQPRCYCCFCCCWWWCKHTCGATLHQTMLTVC